MKANRNRTLAIDGPIRLSVFPRLEVRMSRISLSEAGKPDEFAALDDVDLAVELLPLLRGQLSIDRVHAAGVRIGLLRDAKGQRNIDDLVQPGTPAAGAGAAGASRSAPIALDINSIRLNDVRVRVKDDVASIDGELLLKELSTGRIASHVASKVKLAVQLGLKAPALKGELRGACVMQPDFATGSVRLTEMDLGYKGDAPSASSIEHRRDQARRQHARGRSLHAPPGEQAHCDPATAVAHQRQPGRQAARYPAGVARPRRHRRRAQGQPVDRQGLARR
jgi:AsmA protein